ncbi:uncharacterized protein STEHIDRAFT_161179 [Stereum hirsutum FP-91666 SS1]|uniref:uncharacterized protein n=1 Tax=Stereum hirsutum (strain FP-91666) TaxID=721885 RepID=UPI0004449B6E|nr:uncharacterized protein STEHIDRAFT_161179 [Stereum hirsutum FP-91666 SS1]EIM81824.1 hypothetical protein STEHIDRAFT_161179 [Stereum hirsutum FP-91666 SS1]
MAKYNRMGAIPRCDVDGITRCCALARYIRPFSLSPSLPVRALSLPFPTTFVLTFPPSVSVTLSTVSHPRLPASRSSPSSAVAAYENSITRFHEDPWRVQTMIEISALLDLKAQGLSREGKKSNRKYFATVQVGNKVKCTEEINGGETGPYWDADFTFDISKSSTLVVKIFKKRQLHADTLIGFYKEEIISIMCNSESTSQTITRALDTLMPSKFAESALPQVEFKVELCVDQDTSELAAVVCRARMRASQLQPSFGAVRKVSFSQVQSASDVNRDIMENTWRPFLENIAKFAEVAKPIVELHPYATAACSIMVVSYKIIMDQLQRDINILYLVDMLADIYAFVHEAEPLRRIESHSNIMACLAQQTIDCGYFISGYCSDRFLTRAVKHSLAPTDAAIIKYGRKFTELKAALLAHATINTEITVLRIWDSVTRLETKVDLSDLPYAEGEVSFQSRKQCHAGTREDILTDITRWVDDPSPDKKRILVLTGDAGVGKSAIAHTIAYRYHELGRLASSIFANSTDAASWDQLPDIIFPTVARDLADLDPHYRSRLWENIHSRRALRKTRDIVSQLETFILAPSKELDITGPIVIVIDGLRKHKSESLHHFLDVLAERAQDLPSNFRIVFTTRTSKSVLEHFDKNQSARVLRIPKLDHPIRRGDSVPHLSSVRKALKRLATD